MQDRAVFHSLAPILGKADLIFVKILLEISFRPRKFVLHFGNHPRNRLGGGLGSSSVWGLLVN